MRALIWGVCFVLLTATSAFADCEYRRVSLRERKITAIIQDTLTVAIVEKGMTGVVQFMRLEAGHWIYRMQWDAVLALNKQLGQGLYFPVVSVIEDNVLKNETDAPSVTCPN